MSRDDRRFLLVACFAGLGVWLLPGEAMAVVAPPAGPTDLQVRTYWEGPSAFVEYTFVDQADNETQFEIDEVGAGWTATRSLAAHEGTGLVGPEWFFIYPGPMPVEVCARVRAYNRRDAGSQMQYSAYSNQACSVLR
jgi:hypothetical protein